MPVYPAEGRSLRPWKFPARWKMPVLWQLSVTVVTGIFPQGFIIINAPIQDASLILQVPVRIVFFE